MDGGKRSLHFVGHHVVDFLFCLCRFFNCASHAVEELVELGNFVLASQWWIERLMGGKSYCVVSHYVIVWTKSLASRTLKITVAKININAHVTVVWRISACFLLLMLARASSSLAAISNSGETKSLARAAKRSAFSLLVAITLSIFPAKMSLFDCSTISTAWLKERLELITTLFNFGLSLVRSSRPL